MSLPAEQPHVLTFMNFMRNSLVYLTLSPDFLGSGSSAGAETSADCTQQAKAIGSQSFAPQS